MQLSGIPPWVLVFTLLVLAACGALVLVLAAGLVLPRPRLRAAIGETRVELWVRRRRFPIGSDAVLVPVAPNLKLSAGIARWLRDATAGQAQWDADGAAPLQPGSALRVAGGRYRFEAAVLAVVMDEGKRATPELVSAAVARALRVAGDGGAQTCVVPDMTEDLIRQPVWTSDQQRRDTCGPIARAILRGVRDADGAVPVVRIWAWHPATADVWMEEVAALGADRGAAANAAAHA